jgi:hypothetical protein
MAIFPHGWFMKSSGGKKAGRFQRRVFETLKIYSSPANCLVDFRMLGALPQGMGRGNKQGGNLAGKTEGRGKGCPALGVGQGGEKSCRR